ncbi:MAG TPA: hypothetical protein VLE70_05810 [Anaerolineae bacterium]|nr:hypothetical protein [Anaerolineae bacterium]
MRRLPAILAIRLLLLLLVACTPESIRDESELPDDNQATAADSPADTPDQTSTEPAWILDRGVDEIA